MCVRVAIGSCSDGPNPWREEVNLTEMETLQNYFHQYKLQASPYTGHKSSRSIETIHMNEIRVILMYLSLSQCQSSLSDELGRLEPIAISQLEGIYSQIEDIFQCVKSD